MDFLLAEGLLKGSGDQDQQKVHKSPKKGAMRSSLKVYHIGLVCAKILVFV